MNSVFLAMYAYNIAVDVVKAFKGNVKESIFSYYVGALDFDIPTTDLFAQDCGFARASMIQTDEDWGIEPF